MLLVTGGAGFIGSNFVLDWLAGSDEPVLNLDKLTPAGNLAHLDALAGDPRHVFVRGDICDRALVRRLLAGHRPRAIVHLAAETHVDRSIEAPAPFLEANVTGTFSLLEEARAYHAALPREARERFRFLHVSTDEVYGSLGPDDPPFTEQARFAPSSPYAASKAAADHLVRAWQRTYGLPTLTTNCSNNYGPRQFPEKLIPLAIRRALAGEPIPVYGDGRHVRDWLYVGDHCRALRRVLEAGRPGETYNIGGESERANLDLVHALCALLDQARPRRSGSYRDLVAFVGDRPGHDRRYATDNGKIRRELGWSPSEKLEAGLGKTLAWYLERAA